jgi:hypothetical protein
MIKNFAKVVNGVVLNVAIAEDAWPFADDPHVEIPEGYGIGDLFNGVSFSKPTPIPPTPEQLAAAAVAAQLKVDALSAKADAKLMALSAMTPLQVRAWVAANVANLADAKDALATLAVCVSILARKL